MTPEEYNEYIKNIPKELAITLVLHYADGTMEDWHFENQREAKDFIMSIQAAKGGFGEDWMTDIFRVDIRPFAYTAN